MNRWKLLGEEGRIIWPTMLLGLILIFIPPIERLSYDLPFWLRGNRSVTNGFVLVYVDESTLIELGQREPGQLNPTNHTRLLQRLARESAALVFYDFLFSATNSTEQTDRELADAIRTNQAVVLIASIDTSASSLRLIPPISMLANAAKKWGHAVFVREPGHSVRRLPSRIGEVESAAFGAASLLQPSEAEELRAEGEGRWLNYYGRPREMFEECSFTDALNEEMIRPGYFRNKVVLVGTRSLVGGIGSVKDEFATPWTRFGAPMVPGLEIQATALANLLDKSWLKRTPRYLEVPIVAGWGILVSLLAIALCRRNMLWLFLCAGLCVAVFTILSCWLQWHHRWWGSWLAPAFFQPLAAIVLLGVVGFFLAKAQIDKEPYTAFLSYHTEPDGPTAKLIQKELEQAGERIFYAPDTLGAGLVHQELRGHIEGATYFVLIVSAESLRKCADPDDWVRFELVHAMEAGKRVITVFPRGFSFDSVFAPSNASIPSEARDGVRDLAPWRFIKGVEFDATKPELAARELLKLMKSAGPLARLQKLFSKQPAPAKPDSDDAPIGNHRTPAR